MSAQTLPVRPIEYRQGFLEDLDRVSSALEISPDPVMRLQNVMEAIRDIFAADRAWLLYPCDPHSPDFMVPFEATTADYPGASALGQKLSMDEFSATVMSTALARNCPLPYQPNDPDLEVLLEMFSVHSQIILVIKPKFGQNWLFGLHQCANDRYWSNTDGELMQKIAQRIQDALGIYVYQQELHQSEVRFRQVAECSGAVIWECDADFKYTYMSPVVEDILGYKPEEMMGQPYLGFIPESDHEQIMQSVTNKNKFQNFEFTVHAKDGTIRHVRSSGVVVADAQNNIECIRGVTQDITEAYQLSKQLSYEASHDALTGLVNRREFEKNLSYLISDSQEENHEHALCFLDLDQFKLVNDTCGHIAGDALLKHVVSLLQSNVRQSDSIARLGGDEFGILMPDCELKQASHIAKVLCEKIGDYRFNWENRQFTIGVSIGLSPINSDSMSIQELMIKADAACYAAKDSGGNRYHIHTNEDNLLALRHGEMEWVSRIEQSLQNDRFQLWVQRIASVSEPSEAGEQFEVLLRMLDEDNQIILPGMFLPAAERYKISPRIDRWVVTNTLQWLLDHPGHMQNISRCFINLSGHSLADSNFMDFVIDELGRSRLPACKFCFEVTETAAIANLDCAVEFISKLKQLGCQFALDDFGSGLSSFAYLKNLPVDFLKIDGQFVKDILDDPLDFAMVKSINEIGQVMGKKTIAEFVENTAILEKLREIGVDYAQGYGIARPVCIDDAFD